MIQEQEHSKEVHYVETNLFLPFKLSTRPKKMFNKHKKWLNKQGEMHGKAWLVAFTDTPSI